MQRTLPTAYLQPQVLPNCHGITLALLNPDFQTGPLPANVMRDVIAQPAYWAFCWGSGLALAQYLLANRQHARRWVAGKSVLDLGSGSGIAGIAAAKAGAKQVWACDTDADALAATATNAAYNNVNIHLLDGLSKLPTRVDIALLADVLYDRSNLPLLQATQKLADVVLVADSRIQTLPDPAYEEVQTWHAITHPNLGEFDEFGTTRLFTLRG